MSHKTKYFLQKVTLYFCLVIFSVVSLRPISVLAITDVNFNKANEIFFYDPDDLGCSVSGSSSNDNSSSDSAYNKRVETTLKFLTDKGLSLAAAAGIAGNLKMESGIVPTRIQGTPPSVIAPDNYVPKAGVGFGIAQWTTDGRQANLVKFAKSQNKNITDLTLQLEFLWKESGNLESMMKALNTVKSEKPYNSVNSVIAATVLFHGWTTKIMQNATVRKVDPPRGFEASADTGEEVVNDRGGAAQKIYKDYKGKIADGTGVSGIGTNSASSSGSTASDCGNGAVTGDIVSTALSFALDKPADSGQSSANDAKPAYIEALNKYNNGANPADCGIFVGTVMIASEVDKDYPKSGTLVQLDYVKSKPTKYKVIENPKKSDLQTGDILIVHNGSDHHTIIYTGKTPYPAVDASQDDRVPSVRPDTAVTWMLGRSGVIIARAIK